MRNFLSLSFSLLRKSSRAFSRSRGIITILFRDGHIPQNARVYCAIIRAWEITYAKTILTPLLIVSLFFFFYTISSCEKAERSGSSCQIGRFVPEDSIIMQLREILLPVRERTMAVDARVNRVRQRARPYGKTYRYRYHRLTIENLPESVTANVTTYVRHSSHTHTYTYTFSSHLRSHRVTPPGCHDRDPARARYQSDIPLTNYVNSGNVSDARTNY